MNFEAQILEASSPNTDIIPFLTKIYWVNVFYIFFILFEFLNVLNPIHKVNSCGRPYFFSEHTCSSFYQFGFVTFVLYIEPFWANLSWKYRTFGDKINGLATRQSASHPDMGRGTSSMLRANMAAEPIPWGNLTPALVKLICESVIYVKTSCKRYYAPPTRPRGPRRNTDRGNPRVALLFLHVRLLRITIV